MPRVNAADTHVFTRNLTGEYPVAVRGEGIYIWDADGNRYIDGSGGSSAVTSIGHGVKAVTDVIAAQAQQITYSPGHAFLNQPSIDLAECVIDMAPKGMSKVWLVSGGSEATDNAVKIARQYQLLRGKGSKFVVISRWQSFHGATLGALGVGGHTYRRQQYLPMFLDSPHIPPAYCYRCYFEQTYPDCGLACARALEKAIRQQGADNVAAFIAEPVVGAALGAVPAPEGYFQMVRDICDRYDVLFIADEVMTGFGRTGKNFGIEHWGVLPDLMTCGKGISSGYAPLGAVIISDKIAGEFAGKGSSFIGGHTYSGNPLSAATGAAVLKYMQEKGVVANAAEQGRYLLQRLQELKKYEMVGDVRGKGMMVGFELVQDRKIKEPFPPSLNVAARIGDEALKRGLVTYPGTGSVDGVMGDHVKLAPPLVITREQVDELFAILDEAVGVVQRGVRNAL